MIAAALEPDSSYQTGVDFSVPFLQSKVHIIYTAQHGLNEKSTKIAIMANTATRRWLEVRPNKKQYLSFGPQPVPKVFADTPR